MRKISKNAKPSRGFVETLDADVSARSLSSSNWQMNRRYVFLTIFMAATFLLNGTCTSSSAPSQADLVATSISLGVAIANTQTALAFKPLPSSTLTPTSIPPSRTPTSKPIQPAKVTKLAACWFGPGPAYNMESSITEGETVELLGVGSLPGWYIIRNPYFQQPCWIQAANLTVDPRVDLSQYPLVTPIPLRTPKP